MLALTPVCGGVQSKLSTDNKAVVQQITRQRRAQESLKGDHGESSDMPVVMDYVKQKRDFAKLQKDVASWERKVEIAEMATRRGRTMRSGAGAR